MVLETVQEVSLPNSPGQLDAALEKIKEKLSSELEPTNDNALAGEVKTLRARPNLSAAESGSESGSVKADPRRAASGHPPALMTRQSSAMSAKQGRAKAATEGSTQTMIVETETVSSIPQVALAPTPVAQSAIGTLKTKPSSETIKPKKEKKKTNRKQSAVTTGTGKKNPIDSFPSFFSYLFIHLVVAMSPLDFC
jgi:hypothetical protein